MDTYAELKMVSGCGETVAMRMRRFEKLHDRIASLVRFHTSIMPVTDLLLPVEYPSRELGIPGGTRHVWKCCEPRRLDGEGLHDKGC